MTQDEIIRMAREAGLAEWHESIQQHGFKFADVNNLERFFNLAFTAGAAMIVRRVRRWQTAN